MWTTFLSLCLALSGKAPRRATPPRPAFRRPACRPRVEALEDRCLLSAGALDPTFGSGAGYVTAAVSSGPGEQQVLLQPSGNIVVAGRIIIQVTTTKGKKTTTTNETVDGVATYNPNGSLETAFGSAGIATIPSIYPSSRASGAALEQLGATGDDKILLAGADETQLRFALVRLNANGTLDTTFGGTGEVITPFTTSNNFNESASAVAVTSTGQILAIGTDAATHSVLLARYNANGTLDPTFGSGGKATTDFTSSATNFQVYVTGMALQSDGKFVVVGLQTWSTGGVGMVLRYNANGSLDASFGNGGIVTTAIPVGSSPGGSYRGMALYPNAGTANDGKIVAVGEVTPSAGQVEWLAVRYNANGSLDTTFGNGAGYVIIDNPQFNPPYEAATAVAIESDGKPIIVGSVDSSSPTDATYFQVARLNVDGSLDATFGNGGLVTTAIGRDSYAAALAIQPDGKIVVAGTDFAVARYLPSEPEIGSFTGSPNPVTSGSSTTLTASNITDANPGATITQVAFYVQINGSNTLLGTGTQTSPGVWTLAYTVSLAPGSYTLFAQAEDSYGVFGDPFDLTLQVQ